MPAGERPALPAGAFSDSLARHMAEDAGIDPASPEYAGIAAMARSALGYFSKSTSGAPAASGRVLLHAIYSSLWEGKVPQAELDTFFSTVDMDPARMFLAWRQLGGGTYTVALVPGDLREGDIADVARALYAQRRDAG